MRGGSAAGRRVGVAAVSVTVRTEAAKVAESTLFLILAGIFYFHDKPCAISKPEACATGKADGGGKRCSKKVLDHFSNVDLFAGRSVVALGFIDLRAWNQKCMVRREE